MRDSAGRRDDAATVAVFTFFPSSYYEIFLFFPDVKVIYSYPFALFHTFAFFYHSNPPFSISIYVRERTGWIL